MADSPHHRIRPFRLSRNTAEFPQDDKLFLLRAGRDLEMLGPVVWAEPPLLRRFADSQVQLAGAQRVVRIVPWMAIGTDTPSIPRLMGQVAAGDAWPVLRIDPENDRSIAFAFRIVQAALAWSGEWRSAGIQDNEVREFVRCGVNMGWPRPCTSEDLLPCYTAPPCGGLGQRGAGGQGGRSEWLYWHLLKGSPDPQASSAPGGQKDDPAGKRNAPFTRGGRTLSDMVLDTTRPWMLRCGLIDRPRKEVLQSDRLLRGILLRTIVGVAKLPPKRRKPAEIALDRLIKALLVLLCDWRGREPLDGIAAANTTPHPLCWPPSPVGVDERRAGILAVVLPNPSERRAVTEVAEEFFAAAPQRLGSESLGELVSLLVNEMSGCIGTQPATCVDDRPANDSAAAAPELPIIDLDDPDPAAPEDPAPVTLSSTRAPLDDWRRVCRRNLPGATQVGAGSVTYTYAAEYSTLSLRYRFGLLVDLRDEQPVDLHGNDGGVEIRSRTDLDAKTAFLPLLWDPVTQACAAFALRRGQGFLTVIPACISDSEVLRLVGQAALQFGIGGSRLAQDGETPLPGRDAAPARTAEPEPPCCALAALAVEVITRKGLRITGPTCDGGARGEATIFWGDSRLWSKSGESTASLDKGTKQLGLLIALANANGDQGKLTAVALAKAIGIDAAKSKGKFREAMKRLRTALAHVIRPFVSTRALGELAENERREREARGSKWGHRGSSRTPNGSVVGPPESGTDESDTLNRLRDHLIPPLDRGKHDQTYELRIAVTVDADAP
jgi:hypothetical protein